MVGSKFQRWLLPVALASLIAIAIGGWLASPPGNQMRIIREIRAAGGAVEVYRPTPDGWLGRIKTALPDAFGEVHSVSIANIPVRKHWLYAFRDWQRLNQVWLNRSGTTDADLTFLAGHKELYALYLNGNPITDEGLRNLGPITSLRHLELDWTRVSNLDSLKTQFASVGVLKLRGTPLTDRSVDSLLPLNNLYQLDLSRTRLTDAGMQTLGWGRRRPGGRPSIMLDLSGSRTTVEGARQIHRRFRDWIIVASDGTVFPEQSPRLLWR